MIISILVVALGLGVGAQQFNPGCSFFNGQCVYNIQMGHEQQCDTPGSLNQGTAHSTSSMPQIDTSGGCSCNDVKSVQTDLLTLRSTIMDLQKAFGDLSSHMNLTKNSLSTTSALLTHEQQLAANLLQTLTTKEQMLNHTKEELANVLSLAKTELDSLRKQILNESRVLSSCQGNVNLPQTSVSVSGEYDTFYCGFETSSDSMCGFTISRTGQYSYSDWTRSSDEKYSSTGPSQDHTYGTPRGHYMVVDAYYLGDHSSSSSTQTTRMTSKTFQPASSYCLRFWYNMYGRSIHPINVYTRISGGLGNPILTLPAVSSRQWKLAEVEIDHEHTQHPFQVVIEGSTNAHYTYEYHPSRSSKIYRDRDGNVAVDDVYITNTTCKDIPVCPSNAYRRQNADGTVSCYTFHTAGDTWYKAAETCKLESHKGHLVVIDSVEEQRFLAKTIQSDIYLTMAGQNGFFTNGNDQKTEGSFKWTDTGLAYDANYTDWHSGQPNNVGNLQDCILMQYADDGYSWGDVNCDEKHAFICEITH